MEAPLGAAIRGSVCVLRFKGFIVIEQYGQASMLNFKE